MSDMMTRVLNVHKDIDEIAEAFEDEVRQADENIAKLLKTMKLAVTYTTPELTMRMIEGAIKKFTNKGNDEVSKTMTTKQMRSKVRELISDDNDYRTIRMVLFDEDGDGVQSIGDIIESSDIVVFRYGGFLDDRCERWDGGIVSIEGVDDSE